MATYIYKPTGAVVTAPDGKTLPDALFEPYCDKPKPRKRKEVKAAEEKAE